MKNKIKSKLNIIALIIITLIVLYFSLKDDFYTILKYIFNLNVWWFLLALLFMFIYYVLRSVPLNTFIKKFSTNHKFISTFRITLITQFFNAVTPFSSGGQPFQAYYLKKHNISLVDGTNIIIQNFIVYQIALIILGIFAITYNHFSPIFKEAQILKNLVTLGFIINTSITILLFLVAFLEKLNNLIIKLVIKILTFLKIVKDSNNIENSFKNYTARFHQGAKTLIADKKLFIGMIFINVLALCVLYITPQLLLFSLGHYNVNGLYAIIASSYVMLMGSFVPIPGGSGGLEYGFIAFYGNFLSGPILNATMLLWRFITYYLGMFIGAIAMNIKEK